jgi:nucleoside-diphosphate-sugar epimerase
MRVLLTGASGYIGGATGERFLAAGYEVVALARSDESAALLRGRGYAVARGDLSDTAGLSALASECDGAVHAAFPFEKSDGDTVFTPSPSVARRIYAALQTEARAVRALIETYRGSKKPLVLFTGTGLLGDTADACPDEDRPVPRNTLFAIRARTEEEAVQAARDGARVVVLRAASVYGRAGSMLLPFLVKSARIGGSAFCVSGSERHRWSFVHVEDLADLCLLAWQKVSGGLFHAASRAPVTCLDVAQAVQDCLGYQGAPASVQLEEAIERFGGLTRLWALNNFVDSRRAYAQGWQPRRPPVVDELRYGSYRR